MEHWRFFVAILILLLLMRPVHEYFTEDDANKLDQRMDGVEAKTDSLNNVYDSTKILDISRNLIDISLNISYLTNLQIATKLAALEAKLGDLGRTIIIEQKKVYITTEDGASYAEFLLDKGTWIVNANITYVRTDLSGPPGNRRVLATISKVKGGSNYAGFSELPGGNGFNGYAQMEIPQNAGRYNRFIISGIIPTNGATFYVNLYDCPIGMAYVNIYATKIAVQNT
jgi:hypothetical protein